MQRHVTKQNRSVLPGHFGCAPFIRVIAKFPFPSSYFLLKVILKEREEKKEQRLHQLSTMNSPDHDVPPYPTAMLNPISKRSKIVLNDVFLTTIIVFLSCFQI